MTPDISERAFERSCSACNAANLFPVVRQLRFSEQDEQRLDLALFLNGIPLFTAELKNPLNGQDVEDAIRQYKHDRDPRDPLFAYGRCLAHFAVDPELVFVTTALSGAKTRFLPFNQGRFGGAGNPPVPPTRAGFPTDYLWERIWARGQRPRPRPAVHPRGGGGGRARAEDRCPLPHSSRATSNSTACANSWATRATTAPASVT